MGGAAMQWLKSLYKELFPNGITPFQARRITKGVLASIITFSLCSTKAVSNALGSSSYLIFLLSVTLNSGRRFGAMIEAVVLASFGIGVGLGYSTLCIFISQRIAVATSQQNALAFLAVANIVMAFFHGFVRSYSPRLFIFVFLMFIITHFSFLTTGSDASLARLVHSYAAPMLASVGIVFAVNLLVFPELGTEYLGESVVDFLNVLHEHVDKATNFFLNGSKGNGETSELALMELQNGKRKVRGKLAGAKSALTQASLEISYAFMPPQELKPIIKNLESVVLSWYAVVGACELEYTLLETSSQTDSSDFKNHQNIPGNRFEAKSEDLPDTSNIVDIEAARPIKEISHADKDLLLRLLKRIKEPVGDLNEKLSESFNCLKLSISHCYDVPRSAVILLNDQNGIANDSGHISIERLDICIKELTKAMVGFDTILPESLEKLSGIVSLEGDFEGGLSPRDEVFLLSSFLLNFRELAKEVCTILVDCRDLLTARISRGSRGWKGKSLWFFSLTTKKSVLKYLSTSQSEEKGEDEQSIKPSRSLELNNLTSQEQKYIDDAKKSKIYRLRNYFADIVEFPSKYGAHVRYAIKICLLITLSNFLGYNEGTRQWYIDIRGTWVGFIANLLIESSIGSALKMAFFRAIGVILGSLLGMASFAAGWDNTKGHVVMIVVYSASIIPGYCFLYCSKHAKAAIVGLISDGVVCLSTLYPTVPGGIAENFIKRCVAMLIGTGLALLVQLAIFPVKARSELVNQVVLAIDGIGKMVTLSSQGLDTTVPTYVMKHEKYLKTAKQWRKVKKLLNAADEFLAATKAEPRLKAPFDNMAKVYSEIIFVLHQVADKLYNMEYLRQQYGSALDDFSPKVYVYRRELYSALYNTLRAIEGSLAHKEPLPQFLPSTRIAHLRLVNRVREVMVQEGFHSEEECQAHSHNAEPERLVSEHLSKNMMRKDYMSWSAGSAALEEVIEYIEELISLTKMLMGVMKFRYSFLSRPIQPYDNNYDKTVNAGKDHSDAYNVASNIVEASPKVDSKTVSNAAKTGDGCIGGQMSPAMIHRNAENDSDITELPLVFRRITNRKKQIKGLKQKQD